MEQKNGVNLQVVEYLQTQIARSGARLQPYVRSKSGFFPKRYGYFRIQKFIKDFLIGANTNTPRWVVMPGLSGMGKTTILAQLYNEYQPKVGINRILYISLDDVVSLLGASLKDVVLAYEYILGQSLEELKQPIILFIDEAHRDPKWASVATSIYNKARNVFMVCSGSSAVLLQAQNEDLGRRVVFEKLYPLCFSEYIMIKHGNYPESQLKGGLKSAIYDSKTAEEAYDWLKKLQGYVLRQWSKIDKLEINNYLAIGSLPYAARTANLPIVLQGINNQLDKIINKDINQLGKFSPETLGVIKRLLFLIADSQDGLSINSASVKLGVNAITLTSIIDVLEKAELIIKVPAHGSKTNQSRKPAKFLFMSPAIRRALLDITGLEATFLTKRGMFLEDIVGLHYYREIVSPGLGSITYDSAQASADFILRIDNRIQIAVEVGFGEKGVKQVLSTMQKIKCNYGVVISDSELSLDKENNILKLPTQFFLLM